MAEPARRTFLALGFGWLPFWHRRFVTLDGVKFRVIRRGHARRRYLLIHGNEETARQVLEDHLQSHAGIAYLAAGHERYVPVDRGRLDPNRMFSREGAEKNLRSLNPMWSPEHLGKVLDTLDRHREKLVRALFPAPGEVLFALHNNSEGYSIRDELPISDQVSFKMPDQPNNFFLCTEPRDFAVLVQSPYNVVLEKYQKSREDDGSLSRLAAARGVRYVNLEVALGHTARQKEMFSWADEHLKAWSAPTSA